MAATGGAFRVVFWVAVIPAFLAVALLVTVVKEPEASSAPGEARPTFDRAALRRLGGAYWLVVAVATLFALARFSEAFLVLRVQGLGLPLALAPLTLVTMNVVYALAAYPAGALSDRLDRLTVAAIGFYLLIAADLVLAFAGGLVGAALGVALWGLHLGLTQGVLAALVADSAPADQRGAAFGVFNFASGLAALAASLAAGALWDALGPARDLPRRRARLRIGARRAVVRRARRAEPARAVESGGAEVGRVAERASARLFRRRPAARGGRRPFLRLVGLQRDLRPAADVDRTRLRLAADRMRRAQRDVVAHGLRQSVENVLGRPGHPRVSLRPRR